MLSCKQSKGKHQKLKTASLKRDTNIYSPIVFIEKFQVFVPILPPYLLPHDEQNPHFVDKVDEQSCVIYSELSQKGTGKTITSLVYSFINSTNIFNAYNVSRTALVFGRQQQMKQAEGRRTYMLVKGRGNVRLCKLYCMLVSVLNNIEQGLEKIGILERICDVKSEVFL